MLQYLVVVVVAAAVVVVVVVVVAAAVVVVVVLSQALENVPITVEYGNPELEANII